jgi:hypothetical protein
MPKINKTLRGPQNRPNLDISNNLGGLLGTIDDQRRAPLAVKFEPNISIEEPSF